MNNTQTTEERFFERFPHDLRHGVMHSKQELLDFIKQEKGLEG